jgi:hypothetical protein
MATAAEMAQKSALSRNGLLSLGMIQGRNSTARFIIVSSYLKPQSALSRCRKKRVSVQFNRAKIIYSKANAPYGCRGHDNSIKASLAKLAHTRVHVASQGLNN